MLGVVGAAEGALAKELAVLEGALPGLLAPFVLMVGAKIAADAYDILQNAVDVGVFVAIGALEGGVRGLAEEALLVWGEFACSPLESEGNEADDLDCAAGEAADGVDELVCRVDQFLFEARLLVADEANLRRRG